jgi:tetratricopeptide (TPR) repeat protein
LGEEVHRRLSGHGFSPQERRAKEEFGVRFLAGEPNGLTNPSSSLSSLTSPERSAIIYFLGWNPIEGESFMKFKRSVTASLLFGVLFWCAHPAWAQKGFGLTEKEFVDKWKRANPKFIKGKEHFTKKRYEKAGEELKACLEILPEHSSALYLLAQVDYQKGDFPQALADIEKAKESFVVLSQFTAFIDAQRLDALRDEQMSLNQQISTLQDAYNRTRDETQKQQLMQSISLLRSQLSIINARLQERPLPEGITLPADYSFVHANILFKMNRFQDAHDQYLKTLESDSAHVGAYNNLVNMYYMARDYAGALEYIETAESNGVEVNPKLKEAVLKAAKK